MQLRRPLEVSLSVIITHIYPFIITYAVREKISEIYTVTQTVTRIIRISSFRGSLRSHGNITLILAKKTVVKYVIW